MKVLVLALTSVALASCASTGEGERKVVPPTGSDLGSKPWNDPSVGPRPQGMFGGMESR